MNDLDLMTNEEIFKYLAKRFDKGMVLVGATSEKGDMNIHMKAYVKHVSKPFSEALKERSIQIINQKIDNDQTL
jgi:hypothetical protein